MNFYLETKLRKAKAIEPELEVDIMESLDKGTEMYW